MRAEERIAYVILCHHKGDQALRLASTIRGLSDRARVLLRHNQPLGYMDDAQAQAAGAELLRSSIPARWGRWSLVAAALEAFAHARDAYNPAWTVLISGQDYPVRPLRPWEDELLSADYDAVVPGRRLVSGPSRLRALEPEDGLRSRYTHRWYFLPQLGLVPRLPRVLARGTSAIWHRYLASLQLTITLADLPRDEGWALGIRRRRVPWSPALPCYKGEQWVALSRRAVSVAVEGEVARAWQRYFATTLIPDEAYFPTVLAAAGTVRVKPGSISWLRWSEDISQPHPVLVDRSSFATARASGAPFARKFDADVHPGLLDYVDEVIRDEEIRAREGH